MWHDQPHVNVTMIGRSPTIVLLPYVVSIFEDPKVTHSRVSLCKLSVDPGNYRESGHMHSREARAMFPLCYFAVPLKNILQSFRFPWCPDDRPTCCGHCSTLFVNGLALCGRYDPKLRSIQSTSIEQSSLDQGNNHGRLISRS